jgi:hypothetical protein
VTFFLCKICTRLYVELFLCTHLKPQKYDGIA